MLTFQHTDENVALLTGSLAIDHGDPGVCAAAPVNSVDQRGQPRRSFSDPICDIGAFEVQRPGVQVPVIPSPISPAGLAMISLITLSMVWLLRTSGLLRQ